MLKKLKNKIIRKIPILNRQKEKKFYANLLFKNDLCFDIGANIGKKSKLMLLVGAKVIAFEPQSSCWKSLDNIKHPNFKYFPFAVGATNDEKKLNLSNHSEVASLSEKFIERYTTNDVYWNNQEKVQVKSLDCLINEYGLPNYCKIDVEGYELEILSNLTYKIPLIEFEFTEKFIDETIKILEILDKYNYQYNYILNENLEFQLTKWVSSDEIKDIIKSLNKEKLHGNLFCKITN